MKLRRTAALSAILLYLGLVAILSGCTTTQVGQGATSLCAAAAKSLQLLATARAQGKLSSAQVSSVHQAETLIDPVCTAPNPPADAVAAANDLAAGLSTLATLTAQMPK